MQKIFSTTNVQSPINTEFWVHGLVSSYNQVDLLDCMNSANSSTTGKIRHKVSF